MVLKEFNQKAQKNKSNSIWLSIAGENLLFNEQKVRIIKLYSWLKKNHLLNKGSILVVVEDEMERISLIMALISLGQPTIIFDPTGTQYETNRILTNCDFCAVIAEEKIYKRLMLSNYKVPYLKVVKHRKTTGVFGNLLSGKNNSEDKTCWPLLEEKEDTFNLDNIFNSIKISPDKVILVIFTSGTTSKSKGVEIQFSALLSQVVTLKQQYNLDKNSRFLNTLPLHHVDGLIQGPILAWFNGTRVYRPCIFSTQLLSNYLISIYRERITHLIAVPTMLSLIHRLGLEWAENFNSQDFKLVVSCAGHLELSLWESFEKDFNVKVVNMYGLTETVTSALFSGPDDNSRRLGTLGKPKNCKIKIIDNEGKKVDQGEVGELLISGPQLMRGYQDDEKSSNQIIREGWLYSGDLVRELNTGHIELVGRKKNQIISGGRNISPEEVAEVINLHPDIQESIILGQANKDWGETVCALVVSNVEKISEIELIKWCRTKLSEYKVPMHIFIVKELVKGPSGKILIEDARKQLEKIMFSLEKNTKEEKIDTQVLAIAANVFKINKENLSIYSSPENTDGWDSLAHMNLILALEETFDIFLNTREIMYVDNLERAIEVCRKKLKK